MVHAERPWLEVLADELGDLVDATDSKGHEVAAVAVFAADGTFVVRTRVAREVTRDRLRAAAEAFGHTS